MGTATTMTKTKHAARHRELYEALDEIVADYIYVLGAVKGAKFLDDVAPLIEWAGRQCHSKTVGKVSKAHHDD